MTATTPETNSSKATHTKGICTKRLSQLACCVRFGGAGCVPEAKRTRVMDISAVVGVVAVVLISFGLCGISHNEAAVKHFYWAQGTVEVPNFGTSTYYVGLNTVVKVNKPHNATGVDHPVQEKRFDWGTGHCSTFDWTSSHPSASLKVVGEIGAFCSQCETAASTTIRSAFLALFAALMGVVASMDRRKASTDANHKKFLATCCAGLLSMVTGMIAFSRFAHGCYRTAPDTMLLNGELAELEWTYGPGFSCVTMATLLKIIHIVMHFSVRVPQPEVPVVNNTMGRQQAQANPQGSMALVPASADCQV